MQLSVLLTRRPPLAARHRAARLGIAALLGILFGATLAVQAFSRVIPPTSPTWLTLTPLFGAVFLPPALSLCLDAPVRRSWPILLVALVTLALLVVGIPLVSSVFMASINSISGVNYAVGTALIYAYIASIPLIITAAAVFTVGGLGGYAARWALTAMMAGVLTWAAIGVVVLPAAYAWFYRINPCQNTTFCFSDALYSLLLIIVVGGLVVAPLGGLLGGALRAWVGRNAHAA
jgi:hypothetical protein